MADRLTIRIPVHLDGKTFRKFAIYDTLFRTKRLKKVLFFTGIMLAIAVTVFVIGHSLSVEGANTIGNTFAGIGLFLPVLYLGTFMRSVRYQINRNGLAKGKHIYTLSLSSDEDGIKVENATEQIAYQWDKIFAIHRAVGCTYLYIVATQAFLLPDKDVEGGADKLWEFFNEVLPAEKLKDLRK